MKQKALFLLFALMIPWGAWADVEINGIYYNLVAKAKIAEVTNGGTTGRYSGNIVIPSSVEYEGVTYSVTTIYSEAFKECSSLTDITIPNSVTTIGNNAFYNCDALYSVTIPNSVTSIGSDAFYDCDGLRSVTIGDGVTSIGSYAFYSCGYLNSVTIGNSVTSIGSNAFYGCSRLTSVEIPNSVTNLGDHAFYGCSSLESVNIPNGVSIINYYTFSGCSSLKSLSIPNSVTIISRYAFNKCSSLTSVEIPNSVYYIDGYAFNECSALETVTFGSGITQIGSGSIYYIYSNGSTTGYWGTTGFSFALCKNLETVKCLAENVPNTGATTFDQSLVEYATLYVPEGSVDSYRNTSPWSSFGTIKALTDDGSNDAILIDGIYYVFDDENGTATIVSGEVAYSGAVTIPASVTNDGKTYTVVAIGEGVFQNATGLTAISIPSSVTSIGDNAFNGCGNLTSVTVAWTKPIGINSTVFSNSGNATLHVPSGSESAYASADYWKDFKTIAEPIVFADNAVEALCLANWDADGDGKLYKDEADAVTNLGSVFKENTDIASFDELQYFTGLTSINDSAFYYCSNLASIIIPDNVNTIGNRAFYVCSGLSSLHISANVTSIEDRAFAYCSGLESIVVDGGNTVYDSRDNCNALIKTSNNTLLIGCKNTAIPSTVKIIAEGAFRGCAELISLEIPEGVTTIGGSAFRGCTGLESVTLPSTITSIGTYAFSAFDEVYNLTTVTVGMTTPVTITANVFPNRANSTLYVPKGTKELYKAANYWKEFMEIIEIGEDEPNRLYAQDITARMGTQASIPVVLVNEKEFGGLQFILTLPDGVTLSAVEKTERLDNSFYVAYDNVGDNTYQVVLFNMSRKSFLGNDGELLSLRVSLGDEMDEGDYEILLSEVVASDFDLNESALPDSRSTLTVEDFLLGDATLDGRINVTDVMAVVNCILGHEMSVFSRKAADINADNKINITDVMGIVNIILTAGSNSNKAPVFHRQMPMGQ